MSDDKKCGKPCPEGQVRKGSKCVMPGVTFTTLVMSLNTSALFHLGELEDPVTGQNGKDLILASHTIETMQLLSDKTKGNLTPKEQELLEHVLADLKIRYAKTSD